MKEIMVRLAAPPVVIAMMAPTFLLSHSADARMIDTESAMRDMPLRAQDMRDLRGGMRINGIPVNFSVIVRSKVENALESSGLQTILTMDDAGGLANAITTRFSHASPNSAPARVAEALSQSATSTPQAASDVSAVSQTTTPVVVTASSSTSVPTPSQTASAPTSPTPVTTDMTNPVSNPVASIGDGAASVEHLVTNNQIQAVVQNTMDNVSISHSTDFNVTLPGFMDMSRTNFTNLRAGLTSRDSALVSLGRM